MQMCGEWRQLWHVIHKDWGKLGKQMLLARRETETLPTIIDSKTMMRGDVQYPTVCMANVEQDLRFLTAKPCGVRVQEGITPWHLPPGGSEM